MAGKCTRIEDVFPIEHGDLPASYVSLLEDTFEGCFLFQIWVCFFSLGDVDGCHFYVSFFLGLLGTWEFPKFPTFTPKKNHGDVRKSVRP